MSDEAALLNAILAHPEEDTPRLVYADWLDENGDDAARDRAEFIRIQIELARGGISETRRNAINRRCKALEKAHGKDWRASFRAACGKEVVTSAFRRGFVSDISGGVRLPARFPAIAKVCPIQRVDIDFDWIVNTPRDSPIMARCKALERLRWMECRRFPEHFGKAVLASPHLTGLHTLYLQWGRLADGVELVSRSPVARNLRHLWVWGGAAASFQTGLKAITDAPWPALTQLRLDNLALGWAAVNTIVRTAAARGWHAIHVHDRALSQARVATLMKAVLASKLRSVSLARDCVLKEPPEPVPDDVRQFRLCSFFDEGNELVRWMIANVPPDRFNHLEIRYCRFTSTTAHALAKWPGLAHLRELKLRMNNLGDAGAAVLAASPHLESVKSLLIANDSLTQKGKTALKKAFGRRVRVA